MSGISQLQVGAAVAAAATITATNRIFHVTGTAEIDTINPPNNFEESQIMIIPDAIFTLGVIGNIARAVTAVVGKVITLTYDGTSWYPDA